jgi:hypothetical protein
MSEEKCDWFSDGYDGYNSDDERFLLQKTKHLREIVQSRRSENQSNSIVFLDPDITEYLTEFFRECRPIPNKDNSCDPKALLAMYENKACDGCKDKNLNPAKVRIAFNAILGISRTLEQSFQKRCKIEIY